MNNVQDVFFVHWSFGYETDEEIDLIIINIPLGFELLLNIMTLKRVQILLLLHFQRRCP